jgi:hypothetical protein
MSVASNFTKKVLANPDQGQLVFRIAVLERYLQSGVTIQRTETVGRIKTPSWSLDFGIAPDEQFIHTSLTLFATRLPEAERDHWLSHLDDSRFSSNFLKMTGGHACVDDGGLRAWGEEEALI